MLVLSRQRDETIMIGDEIEITVVDVRGDKVRLGITAPSKIAVHRKEVYLSILRENEQAARIGTDGSATLEVTLTKRPPVRPALPGTCTPTQTRANAALGRNAASSRVARLLGGQGSHASKVPRDGPPSRERGSEDVNPKDYRKAV